MTITDYLKKIRDNAWNTAQLGREFEKFVKKFLLTEPSFKSQFSDVWLWSECPFANGNDVGIDLVAKTFFGEYVAIQAKCYQPGTQVDKADVDTFLSASGKQISPDGKATFYSNRIIIATNDNWTSHASEAIVGQQIPVTRIGLNQIQNAAIDWNKFFKGEKKVIVYTPVPVVDFIIKSVECALKKHFGASISDRGVHVLDPFTGTGTFITRLLQGGFIKPKDLLYKYENEIHANEIVLLAYYIAAINIESVFHDVYLAAKNTKSTKNGENLCDLCDLCGKKDEVRYHPFDGIVLCDTFDLTEKRDTLPGIFPENSERARKQKKLDIRVIIGNPPYNVSKGTAYPHLEQRIAETYAKGSGAVNKNSLYDSYIKAFRWASDRIKDEGVIAFVTNGGWLDAQAMNGFRNSLMEEFDHIYVFNLRGNQRTQGEVSRREGGKIFGSGSRTPVAITILVKGGKVTCPYAAAKEAK